MEIFKGSCTAIVTPFDKNDNINYESFKKLIDFQIENGTSAIVFMGTTGEASTLSQNEKLSVAKFAVEYVNKRVPVILGAGGNNTKEVISRSIAFEKLGADALLQVTPYYNKCTQDGLIKHYKKIANSVSIPNILYNVPSRTSVNILPETAVKLSEVSNIVGIKEASGDLNQITKLFEIKPENFAVYSGDDASIFTMLSLGGRGVISVISNIYPKETAEICSSFFEGDIKKSRDSQFKLLKIIRQMFVEVNPIPVKSALNILGYNVGSPRLPLTELSQNNFEDLKKMLI